MVAFFLVIIILVLAFLIFRNRNASIVAPTDLTGLELRSLSTAAMEITEAAEDQPVVWAACFIDAAPQLDMTSIQAYIVKKWSNKGDNRYEVLQGRHPYQRILDSHVTQLTFEPMTVGENQGLPNRIESSAPCQSPAGAEHCVLIFASSEMGGAAAALHLSQAVLALINTCPQVATVYWEGSNRLLTRAELQTEMKKDFRKEWPVPVWVSVHTHANPDGTSTGFTLGLSAMGGTEFEAINAPESEAALGNRLSSLADYVVANFGTVYNGDTTGIDELERIRLNKRPSETVHNGWVFQLAYLSPSPDSGWSKQHNT